MYVAFASAYFTPKKDSLTRPSFSSFTPHSLSLSLFFQVNYSK